MSVVPQEISKENLQNLDLLCSEYLRRYQADSGSDETVRWVRISRSLLQEVYRLKKEEAKKA
jgi:hypothetical protein